MIDGIRRRHVLQLAASLAATWPLSVRAEPDEMPVIGFLDPRPSPDSFLAQLEGFRRGLKETGFTEGGNVEIAYLWGDNHFDRLAALAQRLVASHVGVMVASGGSKVALVAKAATSSIPIVFLTADDPVGLHLVASLSRPGGNATGVNYFNVQLYAKRLEILRQLLSKTARVALLVNPADKATMQPTVREIEAAAPAMSLQVKVVGASTMHELDAALADLREQADALYVGGDIFLHSQRKRIAELAASNGVPAIYPQREWAAAGGLMSYGTDFVDVYRQAGVYAGRILGGEKPADLPVVQPTRFDFVINLKTAKAQGLAIPPSLLALADEVIE